MSLKKAKMADLINYRLRVVTIDGRQLSGQMLAFDKHMNLVLSECQEFRTQKKPPHNEATRTLGLVILRGETVVSVSVESPPPTDPSARLGLQPGFGTARAIGRGQTPAASLSAPIGGFGAPR